MISAPQILLVYIFIGFGISMFVEKQAIKQEIELTYYCKGLRDSLSKAKLGKTEEAKRIAAELAEELFQTESILKEMVTKREYYTGFSGTLHTTFCWPFIGLLSVGKMIVDKK
jgi:hypothetical protein